MLVLALESSTSSAKALLYDSHRGVVGTRSAKYPPRGEAAGTTDPHQVFLATLQAGRELLENRPIEAVAICGTWHSLAVCDKAMKPAAPTFSWNFMGTKDICGEIRRDEALTERIYRQTGCMPHVTYPRHAIQYLRGEGFKLEDKLFVTQGAYNFYQLTGSFLESVSTQSGTGLINIHDLCYDAFILDYLGIREAQLGRLTDYRGVLPLSREAARALGAPPGIPVVPAHPDGALNQVGNNAVSPGRMTLSVGTSGALRLTSQRPVLPQNRELWCYYGVDRWMSGAAVAGACNCVDWFCDRFMDGQKTPAQMDELAGRCEDAPIFLPFLFGERCPGWRDERGAGFLDVSPEHTAPGFYKAVLMGVLFGMRQCYDILCRESGAPREVLVSGGITKSPYWSGMLADILEREITVAHMPDASLMGAAALALCAAGAIESPEDFARAEGVVVAPEPANRQFYRERYQRYLEYYGGD